MKLRTRTLLSVALSLVSLIAILYSVARVSMMRSFATLEADDTRQNVARATAVLNDDLATLDNAPVITPLGTIPAHTLRAENPTFQPANSQIRGFRVCGLTSF